ncbi:hypothetical protein M3Y94_00489300 [Aphelenchoides besseyi]|nr:hypothetical protein M3Y94_00489300 [Aphelenchoides besseyi]
MDQLKIARQNVEIGHYTIAMNAYKATLLSYDQQIQSQRDMTIRNRLVDERALVDKEMKMLGSLVGELNQIKNTSSARNTR